MTPSVFKTIISLGAVSAALHPLDNAIISDGHTGSEMAIAANAVKLRLSTPRMRSTWDLLGFGRMEIRPRSRKWSESRDVENDQKQDLENDQKTINPRLENDQNQQSSAEHPDFKDPKSFYKSFKGYLDKKDWGAARNILIAAPSIFEGWDEYELVLLQALWEAGLRWTQRSGEDAVVKIIQPYKLPQIFDLLDRTKMTEEQAKAAKRIFLMKVMLLATQEYPEILENWKNALQEESPTARLKKLAKVHHDVIEGVKKFDKLDKKAMSAKTISQAAVGGNLEALIELLSEMLTRKQKV